MTVHKEFTKNNELCLYMNGKLIYKKWLDTGASKVFDVAAYNQYTLTSLRDAPHENAPENESGKSDPSFASWLKQTR